MIQYNNESPFTVIFNLRGSVLPQCIPIGLFTFTIGLALALIREFDEDKQWYFSTEQKWIEDPYPVQVISIVLCFVLIMRTNMALDRWMGGISDIAVMLSKWGDAFDALNAFFSGKTGSQEQLQDILMFRIRVAHWFSLLSCLAFATLRNKGKRLVLEEVPIKEIFGVIESPQESRAKSFVAKRFSRGSLRSGDSRKKVGVSTSYGSAMSLRRPRTDAQLMDNFDLMVLAFPSREEILLLEQANDKPNVLCLWIIQGIIIMIRKDLLDIPPPIVSRVFQELSNGMLGFNQAHKVAMTPFPFPFAQMMSVLLCTVYLIMPFYIDLFTQNPYVTPIISFFLPTVYCALNNIAVELEEPFGTDENDVDIEIKHEDFLWLLIDVLRAPKGCPADSNYELEKDIIYGVLKDCPIVAPEMEPYMDEEGTIHQTITARFSAIAKSDEELPDDEMKVSTRPSMRRCMKEYGEAEQIWPASFGQHQ